MKKALVFILFTGWLAPLWVHALLMRHWREFHLAPGLAGGELAHSFPCYQAAQQLLLLGGSWLSLVVLVFAYRALFDTSTNGAS